MGGFRGTTVTSTNTFPAAGDWADIANVNDLDDSTEATLDVVGQSTTEESFTTIKVADFSGDMGTGTQTVLLRWQGSYQLVSMGGSGIRTFRIERKWRRSASVAEESDTAINIRVTGLGGISSTILFNFEVIIPAEDIVPAEFYMIFYTELSNETETGADYHYTASLDTMTVFTGDSIGGFLF